MATPDPCGTFVVAAGDTVLVTEDGTTEVVLTPADTVLMENEAEPDVILLGPDQAIIIETCGGPGPAGAPGTGGSVSAPAAMTIAAYRVVAMDASGQAYLADPSILTDSCFVVGISQFAALPGETLSIQTDGLLMTPALWAPGPLFLGPVGTLVPNPPVSGYQLQIAVAATTTSLIVRPQIPIFI